ncbi:MAG: hypothetical protein K1X88_29780 [Nannocystaceae bacterium]|nr:hypothetical protein [Nannocystaceae bacterium]
MRRVWPLVLWACACRAPASGPPSGTDVVAPTTTAPARAEATTSPPRAGIALQSRAIPAVDDEQAWLFGLAWDRTGFAAGIMYLDDRDALELRPIGRERVEAPTATLRLGTTQGFPVGFVGAGDPTAPPWLVFEGRTPQLAPDGRFVALGPDGTRRELVHLPAPARARGGLHGEREQTVRSAWAPASPPTGAVAWSESLVRKRTAAERARDRSAGGPHDSVSSTITVAELVRYGDALGSHDAARVPITAGTRVAWQDVALGEGGRFVGAHTLDRELDGTRTVEVTLQRYARGAKPDGAPLTMAVPARATTTALASDGDGTVYLVSDRSAPGEPAPALIVTTIAPDGTVQAERSIAVVGWIADALVLVRCGGRTWLAYDAYAQGHETLDVVALQPGGELAPAVPAGAAHAWAGVDPGPVVAGTRPGRVLVGACGPGHAAVAFDRATQAPGTASAVRGLVFAQWSIGPHDP